MALGIRLEMKQSQQLVMTPQLQQAIKLLQMSNLELSAFVEREVESNPLLTLDEPDTAAPDTAVREPQETALDERVTADGDLSLAAETFDTGSANLNDDAVVDRPAPEPDASWSSVGAGGARGGEDLPSDISTRFAQPVTLRAHLCAQLGQRVVSAQLLKIACVVAGELDPDGFFRGDIPAMADLLGVVPGEIEAALALVQSCEPTGIGACDLAECLGLQLAERDRLDPAMQTLLANLNMVLEGKVASLCRICGVDRGDLSDMLAELRCLNPRPAAEFHDTVAETLIPDLFLRRAPWGGWQIELNSETLPRVLLDNSYVAELANGGEETREFISNCQNTANWLLKSLDQRARTILKVATEIVRHQEAFFEKGIAGLRPLTLRAVADAIDMHESTVSRVTMNKYMSTDRGIFELKFFFTNSVGPDDSQSAEAVRHLIRQMIDRERPDAVLSDDTIVEVLQKDGIDIARRTVAKYRKALKIPSSVDRRRKLAMAGL